MRFAPREEPDLDDTAASLVALIELFAERTGRSVSTASRLATGSGDVVARLRRGAAITTRRVDRALRYLSENWPQGVPSPSMPGIADGYPDRAAREHGGGGARQSGPVRVRDPENPEARGRFEALWRHLAEHVRLNDRRFASIGEHVQAITARLVAHDERLDAVAKRLDAVERRLDRLESIVTEVKVDVVRLRSAVQTSAPRGPAAAP